MLVVEDGKVLVYVRDGRDPQTASMEWIPADRYEDGWHLPVSLEEHERRLDMARNWTKDSPIGGPGCGQKDRDLNPEEERYKRLYGEKMLVCEDLRNKKAAREWSRYAVLQDPVSGRIVEGPLPFRSSAERAEYLTRFGFKTPAGDERK